MPVSAERRAEPSERTGRTEATRQAILEAACEVIAEAGLESVRMRMIADRAAVSTALLHYHFANRETLFLEALKYSYANAGAQDYGDEPPAHHPHAWQLARAVELCLPVTSELRRDFLLWQELSLRASRDASSAAAAAELYTDLADWIAEIVRGGIAAGEFVPTGTDPAASAQQAAHLVIALTQGYGIALLLDGAVLDQDAARDAIWAALSPSLGLPAVRPVVNGVPSPTVR